MRISILSNVNMDMLAGLLKKQNEVFQTAGYGEWVTYALRRDEALTEFAPECLILLLEGNALLEQCGRREDWEQELAQTKVYVKSLAENCHDSHLLVSTIDVRPEMIRGRDTADGALAAAACWDAMLSDLAGDCLNIHRFELGQIIADYGRKNFYSSRFWYMGSIPYDMKALHSLAAEIQRTLDVQKLMRKKVLVLDLDNTIWGGVIGEDGVDGIVLDAAHQGAIYQDAQKEIKKIQKQGILLAIASKNNLEDVQCALRNHPQMILREDDFAAVYADWNPKHENIKKMAAELNLGLDAFVFLDDNEAEQKAVEIHLPEVAVAEFPADVSMLPDVIRQIYEKYFWIWKVTVEDAERTRQYREERERRSDRDTAATYEDYLKSLGTKIRLASLGPELKERAVQLMNKTNQFNVCTLRMDELELDRYLNQGDGHLIMAEVADKYGNNGWVAEFLYHVEGDTAVVDNFLMSCRVMGRMVEDAILGAVFENLAAQGLKRVCASYKKTAKNRPVESLWDKAGFGCINVEKGKKEYELLLKTDVADKECGPVQSGDGGSWASQIHTVIWDA